MAGLKTELCPKQLHVEKMRRKRSSGDMRRRKERTRRLGRLNRNRTCLSAGQRRTGQKSFLLT